MKEFVCFYFEGMSLNLSESAWRSSGSQIPDWTLHFLIDVMHEGFSIVGIYGNKTETVESALTLPENKSL
jgi:hypothetical protein